LLDQHFMKMQQSRGPLRRRPTAKARRPHHENAQTGDDAIGRPKVGSAFPTSIQNQNLMSHQDGFGNHGAEATGLTKSDESDDGMPKKSENVAHAPNGIKLKKLKNSIGLWNSPTAGSSCGLTTFGGGSTPQQSTGWPFVST
jgi:hypothetical protein